MNCTTLYTLKAKFNMVSLLNSKKVETCQIYYNSTNQSWELNADNTYSEN